MQVNRILLTQIVLDQSKRLNDTNGVNTTRASKWGGRKSYQHTKNLCNEIRKLS